MDTEKYSLLLRTLVNNQTAQSWLNSQDKIQYCSELIGELTEHPTVCEILAKTLSGLLQHQAENFLLSYRSGDGVSVMREGVSLPATVIEVDGDLIRVQLDEIKGDSHFEQNPEGKVIPFTRIRGNVFICFEGRALSRLKVGRNFARNTTEALTARLGQMHK